MPKIVRGVNTKSSKFIISCILSELLCPDLLIYTSQMKKVPVGGLMVALYPLPKSANMGVVVQ